MINRYVVYINLGTIIISTPLYHSSGPQSDTGHRTAKVYKVFHLFETDEMGIKLACELNSEGTASGGIPDRDICSITPQPQGLETGLEKRST